MSENVFREILEESLRREYAEFDRVPEHKFSLKHRLAMRKILARSEKNLRAADTEFIEAQPHYGLKRRIIIALVVVILMTLLTGWYIPIKRITQAQMDWLRSRYDFPAMKTRVSDDLEVPKSFSSGIVLLGSYRTTDEYLNFLADLEFLGIYTADEAREIKRQTNPTYTKPKNAKAPAKTDNYQAEIPILGESLVADEYRDHVEFLEKKIAYFIERANDPERAVEGDAEYAELISEKYLSLHKGFLKLFEELQAEDPGDENGSEKQKNVSSNFDKDDKIKLYKINKN